MKKLLLALASVSALGLADTAHATLIENTFGLSQPRSTITFDEQVFPDGTPITTQYSDLGITFSPFAYYFSSPGAIVSPTSIVDNTNVTNFIPGGYGGSRFPVTISFIAPQTEAAFGFSSGGSTVYIQALLGGSVVESDTVPYSEAFYGFEGITFNAISVWSTDPSCVFAYCPVAIDNIQLSTAPELSTWAMILFGFAGLGFASYRQTSRQGATSPRAA